MTLLFVLAAQLFYFLKPTFANLETRNLRDCSAMAKDSWPVMKNDLLLQAAKGQAVAKAPVWVMRQAGRYLPEFKEVRAKHDFFEICRTPELACEITMQPVRRYEGLIDAAIIFSDILVIPQALGMTVEMREGVVSLVCLQRATFIMMYRFQGPVFPSPLKTPEDLGSLKTPGEALPDLKYVFDAISLTRRTLDGQVPLLGFTGAPVKTINILLEYTPRNF